MPQGSVLVFLQDKRRIPHYHNNTSTCTPGQSLSDFPSHSAFICVFSMALYNCTFFSDGNGALSILCLLYHLAQCSAHSRSSITHTHTHHTCAHTHTHTHTHTHAHTHAHTWLHLLAPNLVREWGALENRIESYKDIQRLKDEADPQDEIEWGVIYLTSVYWAPTVLGRVLSAEDIEVSKETKSSRSWNDILEQEDWQTKWGSEIYGMLEGAKCWVEADRAGKQVRSVSACL